MAALAEDTSPSWITSNVEGGQERKETEGTLAVVPLVAIWIADSVIPLVLARTAHETNRFHASRDPNAPRLPTLTGTEWTDRCTPLLACPPLGLMHRACSMGKRHPSVLARVSSNSEGAM